MATDPFDSELSPEVAALFAAARATEAAVENPALFAAMAGTAASGLTSSASTSRRRFMIGKVLTAKAAAIAGALVLSGGVAAAATGTLPDPVQDTASDAADVVGINIPEGNHGSKVSDVARDKSNDGDENHGKTVSETARDNHGHNKDDATTSTTLDDDNSGPGNSRGNGKSEDSHASDNATGKGSNGADDPADHDADDDNGDDDSVTTTTVAGPAASDSDDDSGHDSDDDDPGSQSGKGRDNSGNDD